MEKKAKEVRRAISQIDADYKCCLESDGAIAIIAKALAREREAALDEAAKVADAYTERMEKAATEPHPVTGKENTVAWCKADAGDTIRIAIRALKAVGVNQAAG